MTKKDFIALANMIRDYNSKQASYEGKFTLDQISAIASFLRTQNSNFNMIRWFDYIAGECGPSGGRIKK
jgi:hypothetical protein